MTILVLAEQRDGKVKKASYEAIKAASAVATQLNATVTAVLFGADEAAAKSLGGYGAAKTVFVADERLHFYANSAYVKSVAQIMEKEAADVVMLPATSLGKDLAPRLAVRIDGALAPDVTSIAVEDGAIVAQRPVYAGKSVIKVKINSAKQVFSLRPNVFSAGEASGTEAVVENFAPALDDADFVTKATGTTIASGKIDVAEANVIVSGGRGLQGPEHWPLIQGLADTLGAATGASRAVVDAGWRPHAEQVGQTGKTVSPNLYVACGISGAIQHLAGMSSSKCIVAINKDKDAPIFQVADYGIVGDVFEVVPALTEELKSFFGK
ncbi:MAG: electron transfer flavoprotein subunit alpha/FixB family protein [Bacteroidetes bacterium]|nr:electron transfer flavoprotein subunit alpha/FixB family protein [Bacteroidota bacterium]